VTVVRRQPAPAGFVDVTAGRDRRDGRAWTWWTWWTDGSDPGDRSVTQPAQAGFVDVAAGFNRRDGRARRNRRDAWDVRARLSDPSDPQPAQAGFVDVAAGFNRRDGRAGCAARIGTDRHDHSVATRRARRPPVETGGHIDAARLRGLVEAAS